MESLVARTICLAAVASLIASEPLHRRIHKINQLHTDLARPVVPVEKSLVFEESVVLDQSIQMKEMENTGKGHRRIKRNFIHSDCPKGKIKLKDGRCYTCEELNYDHEDCW